ncbi:cytochrome c oxidase subunit 3 [Flavisphingomonas formosensis]|uniref:cytochrome c oxidase subunit 3 n=1 Tax=Flavisphingomonas formosensis TaxID=861534 RepID=UPI0012F8F328|nr:cytochrome c oxidase subunit 3 [Sphingomonas formosensis]
MSSPESPRIIGSLADLPDSARGAAHLVWWGNLGFMLIEGTGFVLAVGCYLFLSSASAAWPPAGDPLPSLWWSSIFTLALIASEIPNLWVKRRSGEHDAAAVRLGVLAMTAIGLILLFLRACEIAALQPSWHQDAYASVMWMLVILHSSHIVTDWGDTLVQALWLHTHQIGDDQFADVEDNCNYWTFVVVAWLPLYAVIYWLPRFA